MLAYKKGEMDREAMQHQSSMFDEPRVDGARYWRKLAQNVLYALPSRSVVRVYADGRHLIKDSDVQPINFGDLAAGKFGAGSRQPRKSRTLRSGSVSPSRKDGGKSPASLRKESGVSVGTNLKFDVLSQDAPTSADRESNTSPASRRHSVRRAGSTSPTPASRRDQLEAMSKQDFQQLLEESLLNLYGFFDSDIQRIQGDKYNRANERRCQSPGQARVVRYQQKYGGMAKDDQLVRDGYLPKISAMIDKIEQLALDHVTYENYLSSQKSLNRIEHQEAREKLAGIKSEEDIGPAESQQALPTLGKPA